MFIKPPVLFDNGSAFSPDGKTHDWPQKNGYDSSGQRITNIVGHNGTCFMKYCPMCERELPENDFGEAGRDTGGLARRDQSDCTNCRNRYHK